MKDKIKATLNDLSDIIERTKKEEKKLGRGEEQERKYIQRIEKQPSEKGFEDILSDRIDTFFKQVEMAKEIENNLLKAEEEEININKRLEGSDEEPGEQLLKEINREEQETENLIEIFLDEVNTLEGEANELKTLIENNREEINDTKLEEMENGLRSLESIKENLPGLKSEAGEMETSRRNFLAGSAAVATGVGLQSILDKKEGRKKSPEPGRIEEILQIEQLNLSFKAETIRTSPNSGLVLFEIRNNSSDQKSVELDIDLGRWTASGTSNIQEGGPQKFRSKYEIGSQKLFSSAVTIHEPTDIHNPEPGQIGFELKGEAWNKNMSISIPENIAKKHEVSNTRNISAFNLNYRSTSIESKQPVEKSREAIIEAKNTSNNTLNASFSLTYPSGWHSSSFRGDFDTAAAGIVAGTLEELRPGQSFEMITELHKNDKNAPKIGSINLVYFPKNHPEKANYYIIPFNLEE